MEVSSNFSKGFTDEDDDDDDFAKKELNVRIDGKSGSEQKATPPRSKHCVTEQRRRSKINDRFQILRNLIPHSDQKRDKASFLLEVIEYIQFLQEKVQGYESAYPGWNEENTKMMPWVKVLFRSFWEKAQKKNQGAMEGIAEQGKSCPDSPGFMFPGGDTIPAVSALLANEQNPVHYENMGSLLASKATNVPLQHYEIGPIGSEFPQPHQRLIAEFQNTNTVLRPNCGTVGDMLNGEGLTIDECTSSLSDAYSQGLLDVLTQSLQSSGVDTSRTNISVQIKLGKQSQDRTISSQKDSDPNPSCENKVAGEMRACSGGEELEQSQKRHKS